MQCLQKILVKYRITINFVVLHPSANTQGGTELPMALGKGTDQPVKVIGCELDVNCL